MTNKLGFNKTLPAPQPGTRVWGVSAEVTEVWAGPARHLPTFFWVAEEAVGAEQVWWQVADMLDAELCPSAVSGAVSEVDAEGETAGPVWVSPDLR